LAERKLLHLRRDDSCAQCSQALPAGTLAYWLRAERVVLCQTCGVVEAAAPDSQPVEPAPALAPEPQPVESAPGASARQVYERKRLAREQRQRERYGRIGGWAARMSSGPQHERAWAKGAAGEVENAKRLHKRLAEAPVILLHDRRLPGTRANVDHLGIGPGGVTVVDSKKLAGKVRVDWRGGLFSPRQFDLYVNGRRRTKLVESVEHQVEVVRDVLTSAGLADVPVRGALCMADPEGLPLFKKLKIRDVPIAGTRLVAALIARPGELDTGARLRIASVLNERFPPA
jgi:hypothetical protein